MKMHRTSLILIVLLLAGLACSAPGRLSPAPTQAVTQPVVKEPLPTETEVPPTAVPPTQAPPPTEAIPTALPPTALPPAPVSLPGQVVLAGQFNDGGKPVTIRVVDTVTGMTQTSFQSSNLQPGPLPLVGGKSIFSLDSSNQAVVRTGFDGSTQNLSFINPTKQVYSGLFLPSPDGSKIAWSNVVSQDADALHIQLNVANIDGTGMKTLIDETRSVPSQPTPVRWSNDGKSIYYANMPYGIGGYILFFGGPDLIRLDLESGKPTQILPSGGCLCSEVISPDETKIAYIQRPEGSQLNIRVKSLVDGSAPRVAKLPANHLQAGAIVWAPDSQSFLVAAAFGDPNNEAFTVLQFQAADLSSKVLIPDDARQLQPVLWPAQGVVWLNDKDGNAWRMDPATGSLTQTSTGERVLSSTR